MGIFAKEMEVASPGVNGHAPSMNGSTGLDPNNIVGYLTDVLEIHLGASGEDLERVGSLLSPSKKQDTISRCIRFASDSQNVLYVLKDRASPEQRNGTSADSGTQTSTNRDF